MPTQTQTHNTSSSHTSTWRSRTLSRLQNAVPKLKRLVHRRSKKGRKALWKLLEGQRKEFVRGLEMDDHGSVSNLQALLSLPLELHDLETCLHLGVAGVLQKPSTNLPSNSDQEEPILDLASLDADANLLAQFVVGNDTITQDPSYSLDSPAVTDPTRFLDSIRTNSTSPTTNNYKVGGMAQLTAVLLMVAQILIGAQLLKRRRKRAAASLPSTPTSQSSAHIQAQPGCNGSSGTFLPLQGSSDRVNITRGRGRSVSPAPTAERSRRRRMSRSRSRSNLGDKDTSAKRQLRRRSSAKDLKNSLSRSCSFDNEVPPLARPPPAAKPSTNGESSSSSLQDHIQGRHSSTHHAARNNNSNPKTTKHASNEHDDNGTAETDSLSLSEGVPQAVKEDQRQHSHNETHGPPIANSNANTNTEKVKDVLALLSFEGSTRSQLEAGRAGIPPLPTLPAFAQDKFALRLSKLKNELFHVQQEQKNKIQDSTHHIQLRYQETNQQYSDLTRRLQNLTVAVQPATTKPKYPAMAARAQSPQQEQVQANIQANSQEQTKLLNKVNSLQQDLKAQQERHVQELQQREANLQQMKTKIQFMSQELERRVLHSQRIDEERVAQRHQQGQLNTASGDVAMMQMQQQQLSKELQDTELKFQEKERECQELLERLRSVPPPSSSNTAAQNQADAQVHSVLMKELERQLTEQDEMNKRTSEMARLLDVKRADIIERTKHLEQMSSELEDRRLKVESMEANVKSPSTSNISTSQLEKELRQLQESYESQSLECEKLNEIVTHKSKLLQEKEKECLELTGKLEEMSKLLREKEAQIEQLEQDVQDKQDLATQNEAITQELQVQQDLQEKMNNTTLQMIKLLEEKEKSNVDLTNKLEALTEELNQTKE